MAPRKLTTAKQVIDAVGGTKAACDLTGRKPTAISNWRVWDRFPANTFWKFQTELERSGFTAPASLWGQDGAPGRSA